MSMTRPHAERHRTRWQYLRAEAEVVDLQTALSDAKIALFDERERVVHLCSENDTLKIQELEDRQRIQQLLALTQPVTEEITLFKDRIPAQLIQRGVDTTFGSSNAFHNVSHQLSTSSAGAGNNVLRTVFMPNKNVEAISFEIESMRLQVAAPCPEPAAAALTRSIFHTTHPRP